MSTRSLNCAAAAPPPRLLRLALAWVPTTDPEPRRRGWGQRRARGGGRLSIALVVTLFAPLPHLLVPPPPLRRDATDIAFAAATVAEGDSIALYYSLEDRMLRRALIGRYSR